jgi:alanine dehydrogenase
VRVIGAAELRSLVSMTQAVELMKQVFAQYSSGETISPIRTPVELPDGSGVSLFMPAFVDAGSSGSASLGAKIVSVFGGNPERGLPTINAVVLALDPETGVPIGLIEGASVTALRTGAVSGAATDLMAKASANTLTIIGAGVQGVTQAAAVSSVRDIAEIRVIDPNQEARESFANRLAGWIASAPPVNLDITDPVQAIRTADIICTATTSSTPVFEDSWVREGTHINAVGAFTPEMQEIPDGTVARARIVVDAVEAILHEAGDIIQTIERGVISKSQIQIELGHLVSGAATGRESDSQVTLFKSVGNAIQDMVVVRAALEAAESRGIGQTVSLV